MMFCVYWKIAVCVYFLRCIAGKKNKNDCVYYGKKMIQWMDRMIRKENWLHKMMFLKQGILIVKSEQDGNDNLNEYSPPAKVSRTPCFIGKDGTRWRKHCAKKTTRTRQENIIVRLSGVRNYVKNSSTVLECWSLLLTICYKTSLKKQTYTFPE